MKTTDTTDTTEIIESEARAEARAAIAHGATAPWGDGVIPTEACERTIGRRLTADEFQDYARAFEAALEDAATAAALDHEHDAEDKAAREAGFERDEAARAAERSAAARTMGQARSERKSAAARANGARGGRPRGPAHIPAPGQASGLSGPALCGTWARYATGDHEMVRRLARAAVAEGDAGHYCPACIAVLRTPESDAE